jgi:hypothetical protein
MRADMISGVASKPNAAGDRLERELLWRAPDRASNWARRFGSLALVRGPRASG